MTPQQDLLRNGAEVRVPFVKMHGLGNDFVLLDATRGDLTLDDAFVRHLADRREGVGFDQLLVADPPANGADVDMRIYNTDGSRAEQCGNGLRCFARYVRDCGIVRDTGIASGEPLRVGTGQGVTEVHFEDERTARVQLPGPQFAPPDVPAAFDARAAHYALTLPAEFGGEALACGIASMGNPHAVIVVAEAAAVDIERLGPGVQQCGAFPASVNVGFMEVVARDHVRLRVYERGVGETRACGSGACAAVCIGIDQGLLDGRVRVSLPGGDLGIEWPGGAAPVEMTGPTAYVYRGELAVTP